MQRVYERLNETYGARYTPSLDDRQRVSARPVFKYSAFITSTTTAFKEVLKNPNDFDPMEIAHLRFKSPTLTSDIGDILLKILLFQKDFNGFLTKADGNLLLRSIINKVVTIKNIFGLFGSLDPTSNINTVLTNLLLCCRILPPEKQGTIYVNLLKIYETASETAKIFKMNNFLHLTHFVPILFEFNSLPVSYSQSATTMNQHLSVFSETMWDMFPLIVESTEYCENAFEICSYYLERIWFSVIKPKREEEKWNEIVMRIRKQSSWIPEKSVQGFLLMADSLYENSGSDHNLSLFIYSLLANRVPTADAKRILGRIVEAFTMYSKLGIETQLLVSELLVGLDYSWSSETIEFARLIRKYSIFCDKNVLLAAYTKLEWKKANVFCLDDIVTGLQEDWNSWKPVLEKLRSLENVPFVHENLYPLIRKSLEECDLKVKAGKEKFAEIALLFAKLLELSCLGKNEDLELIIRVPLNDSLLKACGLIFCTARLISLSDKVCSVFCRKFLGDENLSSRPLVLASIRLLESAPDPSKLTNEVLSFLEQSKNYIFKRATNSHGFWYFFVVAIKRSHNWNIHEKILRLIQRYFSIRSEASFFRQCASLDLAHLLLQLKSTGSQEGKQMEVIRDLNKSIFSSIHRELTQGNVDPQISFFLFLYGFEQGSSIYRYEFYAKYKSEFDAAEACFLRKARKATDIQVNNAIKIVNEYDTFITYWDTEKSLQFGHCLSILIKEFYTELPFRQKILSMISKQSELSPLLAPRLHLAESLSRVRDNIPITSESRSVLLDIDFTTKYRPSTEFERKFARDDLDFLGSNYLVYCEEREEVINETAKLFANGILDSKLVKFATILFFLRVKHEELTELYSYPIFVSLVRK
jgi:hypothetical protein